MTKNWFFYLDSAQSCAFISELGGRIQSYDESAVFPVFILLDYSIAIHLLFLPKLPYLRRHYSFLVSPCWCSSLGPGPSNLFFITHTSLVSSSMRTPSSSIHVPTTLASLTPDWSLLMQSYLLHRLLHLPSSSNWTCQKGIHFPSPFPSSVNREKIECFLSCTSQRLEQIIHTSVPFTTHI